MVIEIFLKSKNALLYTVESYLLYLWAYSSKNHSIKKNLCQAWTDVYNWNNVKLYFHVFILNNMTGIHNVWVFQFR